MPWTINLCFPSRFTFNMLTNIYPETHVLVVKVPGNKATISTTVYMLKVKASIVCKSFGIGNKHSISGKKCGGLFVYFIKRFTATNHCYAQIIFNCSNGLFN